MLHDVTQHDYLNIKYVNLKGMSRSLGKVLINMY